MFFKKKIPLQQYCTASIKAAFEHSDEATGETFRRSCGDSFFSAADPQLYLSHLRAVFIELMLIAIAKNCNTDTSLQAVIFVHTQIKELNCPQISELCRPFSVVLPHLQRQSGPPDSLTIFIRDHFTYLIRNIICARFLRLKHAQTDKHFCSAIALARLRRTSSNARKS